MVGRNGKGGGPSRRRLRPYDFGGIPGCCPLAGDPRLYAREGAMDDVLIRQAGAQDLDALLPLVAAYHSFEKVALSEPERVARSPTSWRTPPSAVCCV